MVKKKTNPACPLAQRLREARTIKGLSQKQLGILAGIDQFSASPRINQYEQGKHLPDYKMAKRLAAAVDVPVTYLYADDDEMALLILLLAKSSRRIRTQIKKLLKG